MKYLESCRDFEELSEEMNKLKETHDKLVLEHQVTLNVSVPFQNILKVSSFEQNIQELKVKLADVQYQLELETKVGMDKLTELGIMVQYFSRG